MERVEGMGSMKIIDKVYIIMVYYENIMVYLMLISKNSSFYIGLLLDVYWIRVRAYIQIGLQH